MEIEQAKEEYAKALADYVTAQRNLQTAWQTCANNGVSFSPPEAIRFRLPDNRESLTHKAHFLVDREPLDIYIQPSFFEDGKLGEVFLKADKQGSFSSGLVDGLSILISLALQYGVPSEHIIEKLRGTASGVVSVVSAEPKVRMPKSVLDYLARYLERALAIKAGTAELGVVEKIKIDQSEG